MVAATTRGTDDHGTLSAGAGPRVALLLPRSPVPGQEDPFLSPFIDGLRLAEHQFGLQTEKIVGAEFSAGSAADERSAARVRQGDFDLVLISAPWIGGKALLKRSAPARARASSSSTPGARDGAMRD